MSVCRLQYHSLPTICLHILHTTVSLKSGGGLYVNIQLVLTIRPHKHVDAVKSHDDLPVAIRKNSSVTLVMHHKNFHKSAGTSYRRVAMR